MTKTTETRQLRLLLDGVLSAHGVDNLQLSIDLCAAVKEFLSSETPVHTREQIIARLRGSLERGAGKQEQLQTIAAEIERTARIRPVGPAWADFIEWAWKQEQDGHGIKAFLSWWASDEWRLSHPPARPDAWYVQWPQAFGSSGYNPQGLVVE